jgi:hypothetical protein
MKSPAALSRDPGLYGGRGLDGIAEALVSQAFADTEAAPRWRLHSVPEPGDRDNPDSDSRADPRDPRPPHKPGDTQPLDAPPVPKLRPLE